jgi:GMP synthase (glutamine-hydrolysing)
MKRIHILQHVPYETPGCIENWIKDKSYGYTVTELYNGDSLPEVSDIDWLIVMGGPMSVHDIAEFSWLSREKQFIRQAVNAGKVVIGICLGSQLVAEVLGSRVYKNSEKEIGWFPVCRRMDGVSSPLLNMFNDIETVFHWHGDTFEIPEGAMHLLNSGGCMNQCFVYNERVLALQFHVEVTESLLESMMTNGLEEIVQSHYIQSIDQIRNGIAHIKRNNELMYSILDEFDKL